MGARPREQFADVSVADDAQDESLVEGELQRTFAETAGGEVEQHPGR